MTRSLTASSSLPSLKKEAKTWLKALRAGDPNALRRFEAAHPRGAAMPTLRAVQHALAREHGLESWAELKVQLEDLEAAARSHAERVDDFLALACLHYGVAPGTRVYTDYPDSPDRRQRASRMLARHPELARSSIHTAVVCGDHEAVARILARYPQAAREKGGREGWEPLLFVCYGRLSSAGATESAVEIATALLDHGADPNAAWTYDWDQREMAFSALCGVIGGGEKGLIACPPHPRAEALAPLLLDRGADPNQGQALYNTMLHGDDDRWLRALIARGLGPHHPITWEGATSSIRIFDYLLEHAVARNHLQRARTLLEHGAPPVPKKGRSLYERALLGGSVELAELLVRHGASRSELTGVEAFQSACAQLDAPLATRLLAENPDFIQAAHALLAGHVAARDRVDVARLLLELGASPDAEFEGPSGTYRALHQAACTDSTHVTELLIQRGADVDARDATQRATPLAWALHAHASAASDLLTRHTRDVFTLVAGGRVDRLRTLLTENAERSNERATERLGLGLIAVDAGETPLFALPEDEDHAIEVAEVLVACGADRTARNRVGQTPADKARARGLCDLAEWLDSP